MTSRWPAWWMYVIGTAYLCIHLIQAYLMIWGPDFPPELGAVFEDGAMHIRYVPPETPFSGAGLQAGDTVVAISGLPIQSPREWTAVLANVQVGQPSTWEIQRGETRLELAVTFGRATWKSRVGVGAVDYYFTFSLVFLPLALLIGFRRPYDPVARVGSWLFLTASIAFGMMNGWAVLWRQLPTVVQFILWIPEISRFVIEGIVLSFFCIFPRRLFRARWPWFVIWLPVLATLYWRIYAFYSAAYMTGPATGIPTWLNQVTFFRLVIYTLASLIILLINYRWLGDLNEKRRIRVLIVGTAVGLVAAAIVAWGYSFPGYGFQHGILARLIPLVITACPFAFAYAILRHRVLDIQVIIRQGLQYALARGAVLGVIPALAAVFVLDLVVNSQEPLADIFRARGWQYAGGTVLALLAYVRRKQWLESLDRLFFRERYDSQRVLSEVVDEIHEAKSFDGVAARVATRIETALHAAFVSVMIHRRPEGEYRCLASAPAGQACPPIDINGKLIALLQVLDKPIEVLLSESAWLQSRLPEKEIAFVQRARIDLLVPIRMASTGTSALLALGIKRSEEPYTREDQELLEAIASSLGRLLEKPVTAASPVEESFEECPQCGACYETNTGKCAIDGVVLRATHLPRTLAGRYRLERRRGRGGMGTVYAATDTALQRRVAVKVIREDLLRNNEVAQRFHREARAAAAFAHPNVVTVHDYGVDGGTRAFLVMELLEGVTLREEVSRCKRLDAARTVEIFRAICAAVDAAHRAQLIHRDLKPDNIFLARTDGSREIVKVLDFGIAKFLPVYDDEAPTQVPTETSTGMLVGTLGYMSPEQLIGESPAVSWDLWALAVIAYETLTGAMPFSARSDWRLAILAGNFVPLAEQLPNSPRHWQAVFARLFATDRTARPKSASEFSKDLEEALR